MKRLRVGVVYGGRSSEHEVSLASAASVCTHLDRDRYETIPLYIHRDGRLTIEEHLPTQASAAEVIARPPREARLGSERAAHEACFRASPADETIITIRRDEVDPSAEARATIGGINLYVVFPVLHGPYGEDGTLQGLLELVDVPYVGAGVLASAVCMDKAISKTLFAACGLRVVDHEVVRAADWTNGREAVLDRITERLTLPVFVKPANLGSSVGISKARDRAAVATAIDVAGRYDRKIVVEAAVAEPRELEIAILGNDDPRASVPGEIVPSGEFYDYQSKYVDDASTLIVPADLEADLTAQIQDTAVEAFRAVDGAGMARVDFLLNGATNDLYINEINTIPGFTTISMFAKMWAASNVTYPALLDQLIALALERHEQGRQRSTRPV